MKKPLICFLFALVALMPLSALAADLRSGDTISIGSDQIIEDSLFVSAEQDISILGRVEGDVFLAAQNRITIEGDIDGSVFMAATSIEISGTITGSVYAVAEDLRISGEIQQNLYTASDTIVLREGGNILRDTYAAGRAMSGVDMTLHGMVGRNVFAHCRDCQFSGDVSRSLQLYAERDKAISINENAVIMGDVHYVAPNSFIDENSEQIRGAVMHIGQAAGAFALFAFFLFAGASLLVVALVMLWLGANHVPKMVKMYQEKMGMNLLIGFIAFVVTPPLIVFLFMTGIGWMLAMLILASYSAFLISAIVVSAIWLGDKIMRRDKKKVSKAHWVLSTILGVIALNILLFVPLINALVLLLAILLGLGLTIRYKWTVIKQAKK